MLLLCSCATPARIKPGPDNVPVKPFPAALESKPETLSRATIAAVGDLLIQDMVNSSAAAADEKWILGISKNNSGYDALFEDISNELRSADISFANLETPITPRAEGKPFAFNAPEALLDALKDGGVDIVSFANNHVYDQGRPGFAETLENLKNAGIDCVGAGNNRTEAAKPVTYEVNGLKIAFLGYTRLLNGNMNTPDPAEPYVNGLDMPTVIAAVRNSKKTADFVVVSLHWGNEYELEPTAENRVLAKQLFEAGADAIIGHHPHVLEPIEVYRADDGRYCFVVYSLGNFISNQSCFYSDNIAPEKMGDTRDSVILRFSVEKRDYGSGVTRVELSKLYYTPIWTENDTIMVKGKGPPRIRIVSLDRAVKKLEHEIAGMVEGKPPDDEQKYVDLMRALENLKDRRRIILYRLGKDYALPPETNLNSEPKKAPKRIN